MRSCFISLALAACCSGFAQVSMNELFINPPGTDQGQEFIELKSPGPGASLSGLTLVVIEADGTPAGTIDQAISLDTYSTGTNGLLLIRDTAAILDCLNDPGLQGPDAGTNVVIQDFTPDIENGGQVYMLVSGFTGAVGNDLDTDNNGVLDSMPWTSLVDTIGNSQGVPDGPASAPYTSPMFPQLPFTPDAMMRVSGQWYGLDVLGTSPGPYACDTFENVRIDGTPAGIPATYTLTPGRDNILLSVITHPLTYTINSGVYAGGNEASLATSDNDYLIVFNDVFAANGVVTFDADTDLSTLSSFLLRVESSGDRDDVLQRVRAFNYSTNAFEVVSNGSITNTDTQVQFNTAVNAARFLSPTGGVQTRIELLPQADYDLSDGWFNNIDLVEWELAP